MKYDSLNLFRERTRLKRSPVVSAATALFSLSDTLTWQFQKLNIEFCYFSLKLIQDPYVEDVPEVKGYEKLQKAAVLTQTNHLRISCVGAVSKQKVVDASFPCCLYLVFKIPPRKTL